MRETKKIIVNDEEIEICIKLEDGEEDIDPNLYKENKNLEDTMELNLGEYDE